MSEELWNSTLDYGSHNMPRDLEEGTRGRKLLRKGAYSFQTLCLPVNIAATSLKSLHG